MDNRRKQENHPGGGFFASAETVSIGPVESSKVWSSPTFRKIPKKGQYCLYTDIFNRPFLNQNQDILVIKCEKHTDLRKS